VTPQAGPWSASGGREPCGSRFGVPRHRSWAMRASTIIVPGRRVAGSALPFCRSWAPRPPRPGHRRRTPSRRPDHTH